LISARGPHTPRSNKLRFSLGPDPLNSFKNTTKHGLTLPPLPALNSFTHFNLTFPNTYPHGLPDPYRPSFPPLSAPPSDYTQCQVCQSPFDEERMLLCDIRNAGWHMGCLLPPLTTIPAGMWKCPLCTPPAPSSQGPLRHLRLPSPILDPDWD